MGVWVSEWMLGWVHNFCSLRQTTESTSHRITQLYQAFRCQVADCQSVQMVKLLLAHQPQTVSKLGHQLPGSYRAIIARAWLEGGRPRLEGKIALLRRSFDRTRVTHLAVASHFSSPKRSLQCRVTLASERGQKWNLATRFHDFEHLYPWSCSSRRSPSALSLPEAEAYCWYLRVNMCRCIRVEGAKCECECGFTSLNRRVCVRVSVRFV